MRILILVDENNQAVSSLALTLAPLLHLAQTVQVIPLRDARSAEWEWADWIIFGFSHRALIYPLKFKKKLRGLIRSGAEPKLVTLYQVQNRAQSPLTWAHGFALARLLQEREMVMVMPPTVFFVEPNHTALSEGELLRAEIWFHHILKALVQSDQDDFKDETHPHSNLQ